MNPLRLAVCYVLLLGIAAVGSGRWLRGTPQAKLCIASLWKEGTLVDRAVVADEAEARARLQTQPDRGTLVCEQVEAVAPLPTVPLLFSLLPVPGRDGVRATLNGRTVYATVDDLLSRGAYDQAWTVQALTLSVGLDRRVVLSLIAQRFGVPVPLLLRQGRFERVRFARRAPTMAITADTLTPARARQGALDAAHYLARGVDGSGHFRYLVDAALARTLGGYNWARHAGTAYFLALAARTSHDEVLIAALRRSAQLMRTEAMRRCGPHLCVGDESRVNIGTAALAMMTFVEIDGAGFDSSYAATAKELAAFVRSMQRPDGEFFHIFDTETGRPLPGAFPYFSGEAALALSRVHRLTGDPADLAAARRAVDYLVSDVWHFFGDRYYMAEEHWTCQAVADLWDRSDPGPADDRRGRGLDFCLRWHALQRAVQAADGETPFDADGAFVFSPFIAPRTTLTASRAEAAIAALSTVAGARPHDPQRALLDRELRRALAFLLRQQFAPGPTHLFAQPAAVHGAIPGSAVDWQLRIDYAMHAGSALLRWAAFVEGS